MVLSLSLNKSLFFLFLFTLFSSFLAYKIVVTAYSGVYDIGAYDGLTIGKK